MLLDAGSGCTMRAVFSHAKDQWTYKRVRTEIMNEDITRIVFTIMFPLGGAVGAAALFIGGCIYFRKERPRGTRLIIAGLLGMLWGSLRIVQRLVVHHDDYRTRWMIDHAATFVAGAGLVMLVLVLIEESKRKKRPNQRSQATV